MGMRQYDSGIWSLLRPRPDGPRPHFSPRVVGISMVAAGLVLAVVAVVALVSGRR